jgi:hypothetical protein
VVIEYNPTIPNAVAYVQPREPRVQHGSGARALVELAHRQGYRLVAATTCNLILVAEVHLEAVLGPDHADAARREYPLSALVRHRVDEPVWAMVMYDGSIRLSEPLELPWHRVRVDVDQLQALPRWFRSYPHQGGGLRRWRWRRWKRLRDDRRTEAATATR